MNIHEKYIQRCIALAKNGLGTTSPNPMVGCVIVYDQKIIGEGYTSAYGGNHAEVNAIQSVKDKALFKKATLYVSLEPCNHFGKTPPCTDLIIKNGIKNVVIGCVDPFEKVAGSGIKKLKDNGCNVIVGVLERECIASNKRFFTYQNKKRPYIILKWAETKDGFIDVNREVTSKRDAKPNWITNQYSRQLVHKWRAEEDAILVGTNTVLKDNPKLTIRDWNGVNPVRVVLDKNRRVPSSYNVYNKDSATIVLTKEQYASGDNITYEVIDFTKNIPLQVSECLYKHRVLSIIIEGGRQTLQAFIDAGIWDEARIFTGNTMFEDGIPAPKIKGTITSEGQLLNNTLKILVNQS